MFKIFKSNKSTTQTIAEARNAYSTKQSKANDKAAAKRRKLFDKFFKKIAKNMKDYGHYTLNLEEMKELNGWTLWGLDVHSEDRERSMRNEFDNHLELCELKKEHGSFYTGQLREFLLEAREAGLVIKHSWSKSNTFTGWTVVGLVFSFPRDEK